MKKLARLPNDLVKSQVIVFVAMMVTWAYNSMTFGCSDAPSLGERDIKSSPAPASDGFDNWLSDGLHSVPINYGPTYLRFANLKAAREVANAAPFRDRKGSRLPWTYDYIIERLPGSNHTTSIHNGAGLDLLGLDTILWAGERHFAADGSHITIIQGGFNNELAERLRQLNYKTDIHHGIAWYYAWSDLRERNRVFRASPFSTSIAEMNAIAPVGNRLLIRRWPASMEHQIDVDRGAKPSLWDAMPFRELAQAIGMELIAGAFVTPSNVSDASSEVEYTISPHRYLGYAPELKSWKSLGDYTVAIVGYSVDKGEEYSTLALHYADADMAERKASELEARINALSVHLYSDLGSKSDESLHFAPVGTLCKSLEARTLTYTKFSVLVLDCAANDGGVGLSGRNLWDHTLTYHTLDFLIPDIDHLK